MKKLTIFFVLILSAGVVFSQNLVSTLEFKNAIAKETRSESGKPGMNYWQNRSVYDIDVRLTPETRTINGKEKIQYFNNSPDTLQTIVVRLYQNFFKKNAPRDFEIDARDATDGVQLLKIIINGEEYKTTDTVRFSQYSTNFTLLLKSPIQPHSKAEILIDWSSILPHYRNVRAGTYDSTTFFVGYWYPQIAVYDDIHGWDMLYYSGLTEFYNDCNDFNVNIRVPDNFIVWATGLLQNKEDIFTDATQTKLNSALTQDAAQRITGPGAYAGLFKNKTSHIFRYSAQSIPDFAFAASNKLFWDVRGVLVDSTTNRRSLVQAIYPLENKEEKQIANTAASIMQTFSFVYPRIPYPYPSMTVFINTSHKGGMEFTMMVNDGIPPAHASTVELTAHEIAHSYFPFYMGINERRFAWMDEGWATNIPFDVNPGTNKFPGVRENNVKAYLEAAGTSADLPLMVESYLSNGIAYRNASYSKPACMYDIMSDMVGKENFIKAIAYYVEQWHQKHPQPHDFFNCFNSSLGKNYNWYWRPWFEQFAYPGLAIAGVNIEKSLAHVSVKNTGGIAVPVDITLLYSDGSKDVKHFSAAVWENKNQDTFDVAVSPGKQVKQITLGSKTYPDIHKKDNVWNVQ
jgi:hypothetical protein